MSWLIDKSAYVRLGAVADADLWLGRIDRGLVCIATVTRLEIGYSIRSLAELDDEEPGLLGRLVPVITPPAAEERALQVQRRLTETGHHRGPGIPDLLIVAIAEIAGHTVLHLDHDFDDIARFTGPPVERLGVP